MGKGLCWVGFGSARALLHPHLIKHGRRRLTAHGVFHGDCGGLVSSPPASCRPDNGLLSVPEPEHFFSKRDNRSCYPWAGFLGVYCPLLQVLQHLLPRYTQNQPPPWAPTSVARSLGSAPTAGLPLACWQPAASRGSPAGLRARGQPAEPCPVATGPPRALPAAPQPRRRLLPAGTAPRGLPAALPALHGLRSKLLGSSTRVSAHHGVELGGRMGRRLVLMWGAVVGAPHPLIRGPKRQERVSTVVRGREQ